MRVINEEHYILNMDIMVYQTVKGIPHLPPSSMPYSLSCQEIFEGILGLAFTAIHR